MGDADQEHFELLYAAHYDRVLAYTLCRASVDAARDATAETFLVAWRQLGDVPEDPLPWLIGVARRCLADQRRSTGRRDALALRLSRVAQAATQWDDDPADAATERGQMAAAMRQLSGYDREILRLVAWDGLSTTQAAQSLGCTRAAFAVRLHRARRRLVGALDAEEAYDGNALPGTAGPPPSRGVCPLDPIHVGDSARVPALTVAIPLSPLPEEAS
ncbi:MAG: sigma-70 family RNA polymerase sigma factor [Actinomycetota bacterium]|nr:sigma-70 family RNA polymerase sigma factor [Actinomycetota bacterium]